MNRQPDQEKITIIAEIHPQHGGSMSNVQTMMLQAKMAGADAIKLQLYDTQKLHGDNLRKYLEISKTELAEMKHYADHLGIELFASLFHMDRLSWCEELNFNYYKIASRTVKETELCQAIINTGKTVFISLGMYDWKTKGLPYEGDNIIYFYCVAQYPTLLEDVNMPSFPVLDKIQGYSDHTLGIGACLYAVSKGAKYIEKHFSLNTANQFSTQKAHICSMEYQELALLRQLADSISLMKSFEH